MKHPTEIVLPGLTQAQMDEATEKAKEANRERFMARRKAEFDAFTSMRRRVEQDAWKMRGKFVPLEVDTITLIPSLHCMAVNNCVLLSFNDANNILSSIEDTEANLGRPYMAWESFRDCEAEIEKAVNAQLFANLIERLGGFEWLSYDEQKATVRAARALLQNISGAKEDDEIIENTPTEKGETSGNRNSGAEP